MRRVLFREGFFFPTQQRNRLFGGGEGGKERVEGPGATGRYKRTLMDVSRAAYFLVSRNVPFHHDLDTSGVTERRRPTTTPTDPSLEPNLALYSRICFFKLRATLRPFIFAFLNDFFFFSIDGPCKKLQRKNSSSALLRNTFLSWKWIPQKLTISEKFYLHIIKQQNFNSHEQIEKFANDLDILFPSSCKEIDRMTNEFLLNWVNKDVRNFSRYWWTKKNEKRMPRVSVTTGGCAQKGKKNVQNVAPQQFSCPFPSAAHFLRKVCYKARTRNLAALVWMRRNCRRVHQFLFRVLRFFLDRFARGCCCVKWIYNARIPFQRETEQQLSSIAIHTNTRP